jgi:hypothetical protein
MKNKRPRTTRRHQGPRSTIELIGGPQDGHRTTVPDVAISVVVEYPGADGKTRSAVYVRVDGLRFAHAP